jgi:hypothetical protein
MTYSDYCNTWTAATQKYVTTANNYRKLSFGLDNSFGFLNQIIKDICSQQTYLLF